MKKIIPLVFWSIIGLTMQVKAQKIDLTKQFNTRQILVVTAANWDTVDAKLNVFEWNNKSWQLKFADVPVTLGRTGLAWGKGLQSDELNTGVLKKEGDGKSPAGIFSLGGLFGYEDISTKMKFLKVSPSTFCVDDQTSAYYNQVTDTTKTPKTWNSAEEMRRNDDLYKYGVFVNYNTEPIVAGAGSCIFMHIWRGAGRPTAGCTAMTEENMLKLFSILDAEKKPLLIQMPRDEYEKLRNSYQLPDLH
ncbi:L,D-transpeptidase family protein [Solitalea sp. MAHUQ-68]|uniref:L,D-transpeptidase family protein n=1 Tax=Solitalea agri TaxID=2953739 RepID=A0A9X2F9M6_9SPHI|nr:L,D-transpeptidase family protein [Solitalea agri]MCO4294378.1 L,D-transpeptidase family protein [Solitalea agri]